MTQKPKRMCFREVNFPLKANLVAPLLDIPGRKHLYPFPLQRLIISMTDAIEYYHEISNLSTSGYENMTEYLVIQPLEFEQLYPHRPEHWSESGEIQPDLLDRISMFVDSFVHPEFYHVLVTPDGKDQLGEEFFTVDIPFLLTKSNTDIDRYIQNSNLPVDPTTKHSAFYLPGHVYTLNVRTQEISTYPGFKTNLN